jgi:hypothetical protein
VHEVEARLVSLDGAHLVRHHSMNDTFPDTAQTVHEALQQHRECLCANRSIRMSIRALQATQLHRDTAKVARSAELAVRRARFQEMRDQEIARQRVHELQ